MKKHLPKIIICIVVLTFLFAGWRIDTQRAAQRSVLSGFFESTPTQVASRTTGRVQEIYVHEGDKVMAGQALVSLESRPELLNASAKEHAYEQALAQLREAQHGPRSQDIERAQALVDEAKASLSLVTNGPRQEDIAQARAKLASADAAYRKALAGPRPQEIAAARAAAGAAGARYAQAQRGLTPEEVAEAKARLDAAQAQLVLAQTTAKRYEALYSQNAVTAQQNDQQQTNLAAAAASQREAQQAYKRAAQGTPKEEMDEARQSWKQAGANLELVLAGTRPEDIAQAHAQRDQAQSALDELLHGSRPEDIAAAKSRLAQAEASLAELRAGTRPEEIDQARSAMRAAMDLASSAVASIDEHIIRAPRNGTIQNIPVAVGDLLAVGTPVARLDNPTDIWIRVYVPERVLAQIAVGDTADIRVDGIPAPISAKVESIASQGEFTPSNLQSPDDRGAQDFAIRLRLSPADARVKSGMYATVTRIGSWQP